MLKKNLIQFLFILPIVLGMSLMSFQQDNKQDNKTEEEEKTGVYVEESIYDFGTVSSDGEKVVATFTIYNKSEEPVTLTSVRASCGCTVPSWSKEPIAAGESVEISATFNPRNQSGAINKSITAKTDSGLTLRMYIKGIVN